MGDLLAGSSVWRTWVIITCARMIVMTPNLRRITRAPEFTCNPHPCRSRLRLRLGVLVWLPNRRILEQGSTRTLSSCHIVAGARLAGRGGRRSRLSCYDMRVCRLAERRLFPAIDCQPSVYDKKTAHCRSGGPLARHSTPSEWSSASAALDTLGAQHRAGNLVDEGR